MIKQSSLHRKKGKFPFYVWGMWDKTSSMYGAMLLRCGRPKNSGKFFLSNLCRELENFHFFKTSWAKGRRGRREDVSPVSFQATRPFNWEKGEGRRGEGAKDGRG